MGAILTPKKVEVMIKNHHNRNTMAEELGLTVEDLDSELRKLYTNKAYADISRRLKANEKLAKKFHSLEAEDDAVAEAEAKAKTEVKENNEIQIVFFEPQKVLEADKAKAPSTLEEVLEAIEEKRADLNNLERKHQKSVAVRNNIRNRIEAKKSELLKLQERVQQIQQSLEECIAEFDKEEKNMKHYNVLISSTSAELDGLIAQKKELEKISIWVFSEGMEIDNQKVLEYPDEWEKIYRDFYGNEALDLLTGFEQKYLAKVFALLKTLKPETKFEIMFESDDMFKAYESLKGGIL